MTANGKYLYIEFVMANWVNTFWKTVQTAQYCALTQRGASEVNPNDLQPKTSAAISKRS